MKRLFAKWTKAVAAMAALIGKKRQNAGNKSVPNPNPEKKVSKEAKRETIPMIISSVNSKFS